MYRSLRLQTLHYFARPHVGPARAPIQSPAAWRGTELKHSKDWQYHLNAADIEELDHALSRAMASGKPMSRLQIRDFPLFKLKQRLALWRWELQHGRGFMLIRGLPTQGWSPYQIEMVYWCLGLYLGKPGAQNPQGDLLGHVRDQLSRQDVRLYRTNKAIAVHCDAADVVGLLCLQPARQGGLSRLSSSVTVFNQLLETRPDLVPRLFSPLYFDTKGEGGLRAFPVAPCAYANGELRSFWQSDYFRTVASIPGIPELTGQERALLDTYDALANDPNNCLDMELQAGDLQLVSNHTVLHARTAFEDWPEPDRRRHLLRLWLSLPRSGSLRERYLIARSWAGVTGTAVRELIGGRIAQQLARLNAA